MGWLFQGSILVCKVYFERIFHVYYHCYLLQLACVQTAHHTKGTKHVSVHYSPKGIAQLKEMQRVIDLPELKMIKPSDTHWLSHEQCVKAVKESYSALAYTLNNIYEETYEPEALSLIKACSDFLL